MSDTGHGVRGFGFRSDMPTLDFDVIIHFVRADDLPAYDEQAARESDDPTINPALMPLSPGLQAQLKGIESEIMGWLASDPTNVVAFAGDPISALSQAHLPIDPVLIDHLRQVRYDPEGRIPWSQEVRLSSLRFSVGP
jgi:hypothetical protein